MEDEEIEKFEITDYDLDNEFNVNRPRRRLSKHQQIYGIWSHDILDEEEEISSRPHRKSYKEPVFFVSGGIQQPTKKNKVETDMREVRNKHKSDHVNFTMEDDNEDSVEEGELEKEEDYVSLSRKNISSSSDDSENDSKILRHLTNKSKIMGHMSGFRQKSTFFNPCPAEKGLGSWEKHTKGIGAKLLLKMGFQPGKGLGKDLQGISAPVEAYQRKGRGSIGAYGPEKCTGHKLDTEEESDKVFVENSSKWKRNVSGKNTRVRYFLKSIDEVLEQGKLNCGKKHLSKFSEVKVIDMTGPEQRILSGYHAIAGQQRPREEWEVRKDKKFTNFSLPELQHNINILVNLCEEEIITNDCRIKYISDQKIAMDQETETLQNMIEKEIKQIKSLESVLNILDSVIEKYNDIKEPLKIEIIGELFKQIHNDYYEEYVLNELGGFAAQIVIPLLKEKLKPWNPLENPSEHLELFKYWKYILETCGEISRDPYHQLLWEAWMPYVTIAINNWNPRSCEALIQFLEYWLPLISLWIFENIREQLILPRLQHEVEEWNPMTDTVPVHAWIHPWIPLLGDRMQATVYPIVMFKLSKALLNWHPSDRSAKLMLQPWNEVFSRGDMDMILVQNILPKLRLCLQDFVINPHEQHLDQWNWVMDWENLLPTFSLASLLERFFFPNWLQVLTTWLKSNPNYDDISTWYMGWKGMLSKSLLAQPGIKEQFRKALDIMNRAMVQPGQIVNQVTGAVETVSCSTDVDTMTNHQSTSSVTLIGREVYAATEVFDVASSYHGDNNSYETMAEAFQFVNQAPQCFRDLIQNRCEKSGIVFVPIPNKYYEAKQVYRCGNVQVYIDRNVAFVSENGNTWSPISLNKLLDVAVK